MCYSGQCPHEGLISGECNLLRDEMIAYHECKHLHVTIHRRLYARETRFQPAEYEYKAECTDCGEWVETEDVPEGAEEKDA